MTNGATISAVSVYLPEKILDNAELVRQFGTWTEKKIFAKTGILKRHIVDGELASDIATKAAESLFTEHGVDKEEIDFLLLCTECPDYFLPATACVVHDRIGLRNDAGALDYNLGCSGFVYGLSLGKALVVSGQARKVLLITADTISRTVHPLDKSTRTVFGDAACAILIEATKEGERGIGEFVLGTDGSGKDKLIIPAGAWAQRSSEETRAEHVNRWGNVRTMENLYMDGPEVLNFTLEVVPPALDELLRRNSLTMEQIDKVVFHQGSLLLLERLRDELAIDPERFIINIENYGNTVSSTIPLALHDMVRDGELQAGMNVLVMGFGVGLSWAGTIIQWR